jgi:hypothetical protein
MLTVNVTNDARGYRVVVPGLIDVMILDPDVVGRAHVEVAHPHPKHDVDLDDYPLLVRVDNAVVVNRH